MQNVANIQLPIKASVTGLTATTQLSHQLVRSIPASCDVEIFEGPNAIAKVETAWRELARQGGAATAFQSYSFAKAAAAAHICNGESPRIAVLHESGRPILIFPTVVTSVLGLPIIRFLGDPLTQYGDVLAVSDVRAEHFSAAWNAVADPRIACFGLFRKVRADGKITKFLAQVATIEGTQQSPFVELQAPDTTSSRDKRELRRLHRRLTGCGKVGFRILRGPAVSERLLHVLKLKREWLKAHMLLSTVVGKPTWERALAELAEAGSDANMQIAELTVNGELVAAEVAFIHNGRWYAYLGAFASKFARFGPGQVQMLASIAQARAEGFVAYDLLSPSQPYKVAISNGAMPVHNFSVRFTSAGRLVEAAIGLIPVMKSALRVIPPGLRRIFMTLLTPALTNEP